MLRNAARRRIRATWLWAATSALISTSAAVAQQQQAPPSFSSTPVTAATVGASYSYSIKVTDPNPQDKVKITAQSVPKWIKLVDNGDKSGTLSGVPAASDVGASSITLEADDGKNKVQQKFTLTVTAPVGIPVGAPDTYSATAGTRLDVKREDGVLANDTDPNGDKLTAILATNVAHGTLQLESDGHFRYDAAAGFTGADSFTYRASDGGSMSAPVTVTINVAGANRPPTPANDSYSTTEGTQLTVAAANGVLTNDSDPDGNSITAVGTKSADHGTVALAANGSFVYTPAPGFAGNDTFKYRASDGKAQSGEATVTIAVTPTNKPPVAAADVYSSEAGKRLAVSIASGVLANDSDPEGANLTAALTKNVEHGTLVLAPNGSFDYTSIASFNGADTFRYRASDGKAQSAETTVTITVAAGNAPPVAVADNYSTAEKSLAVGAANGLLHNDTDADRDPLTAALFGNVKSGTLALNPDGSFTYTPETGFTGKDTFTYKASDGKTQSAAAEVVIEVTAKNKPPTTAADAYSTNEDTPLTVPARGVLANDSDPDGDPLTAALAGNATSGSVTLSADGSFTYTPVANFNGTATFSYQARDATESSAAATVTISVAAVNDAPFITSSPPRTVAEHVTYSYTLTASDPDGTPLTVAAPKLPAWLKFISPATITGVPAQKDAGVHDVTMTVSDGVAPPVAQSFQITVQIVDDPPLIAPIPDQTATERVPFALDLAKLVTDLDTPASAIAFAASGALPAGLALSSAGALTGAATQPGDYTVSFSARDAATSVPGRFKLTVLRAGRTDLSVRASAAPTLVAVNTVATWTLTVANNASDVTVDRFSLDATFGGAPFTFDAVATTGCTVTTSGNESRLACTLGPLAGGAAATVTLTGRGALQGDVLANVAVAVVGGAPLDETPANDRATSSLSVAQNVTAAPAQMITGLAARAAAAGDLNGDRYDDLAIVTGSTQGTVVLLDVVDPVNPNKRALSTTPTVLGGDALGTDIALADLDLDSDLDLIVAAGVGAPNRIYRNSGSTFEPVAIGAPSEDSRAVAVGDLNGDSFPDLVFANNGASAVYLSQNGATFARTPFGSGDARDVVVADLFGDPLPEVVIAYAGADAAVYRNTAGVLALELTLATGTTTSVAAADLNNDGRADLVFGRSGTGNLVFINTSGTKGELFMASKLGSAVTSSVLLGDFDLDRDNDLFVVNGNGDQVYTNVGNSSGTFVLHPRQLTNADARMATAGKFSIDDRVDVAVIAGGGAAVFFNDGAANFGQGDMAGPTVQIRGDPTVTLTVGDTYADTGATASDAADGDVSSRITVKNPVNTAVIGTYTVTYDATDLSGNSAAPPATRTVRVQARENEGGGGGGALGVEFLLLLLVGSYLRRGSMR